MIKPGTLGELRGAASDEHRCRVRQGTCPVGCADLICDNSQLVALGSEPSHRGQEVLAAKSVDPAGTQYQTWSPGSGDRALSAKLAATVSVDGTGNGLLVVRCRRFAVENVVGRVVNQDRAGAFGFLGENAGSAGIDRVSLAGLAFRAIDRGIGAGVDDESRSRAAHRGDHRVRVSQ